VKDYLELTKPRITWWFLYSGVRVSLDRTKARARRVLLTSVVHLPVLYALMLLDPVRL
jgi:heme O synthase-like polyprenyltransferase